MRSLFRLFMFAALAATVGLAGCGDDTTIIQDPAAGGGGGVPTTAALETCAVCHNSVADIHAPMGVPSVEVVSVDTTTDVSTVPDGVPDLVVEFDGMVDGVPAAGFTYSRGNIYYEDEDLAAAQATVDQYPGQGELDAAFNMRGSFAGTVTANPNIPGRYTLTVDATAIPGTTVDPVPATPLTPAGVVNPNASYLVRLNSPAIADGRPHLVVDLGTPPVRDLITNDACAACHGPFPAFSEKFMHAKVGGFDCQKCHQIGRRTTGYIARDLAGGLVTQDQVDTDADGLVDSDPYVGGNLVEYIHGIHNSHNMPEETYFRTTAADGTANIEDRYSVGFPSDMRNCSVCHADDGVVDRNAIVAAAPVSYSLCFSCHNNWDNFTPALQAGGGLAFHQNLGPFDQNGDNACLQCHVAGGTARPTAGEFHNNFILDSHTDSFFEGEDISFTNPDQVTFAIGDVTADGSTVSFTWTASKLGAPVDPCNTDLANGPTYQELGAYLAYAKGDDWVNEFVGNNPGQPLGARDLFGDLTTTCAANVATTTGLVMDPEAVTYADKVLLAIGGKPADRFNGVAGQDYFVREVSPTFAFDPATGAAAVPRRSAVDNDKCLGCHQGTLYQHGGDRVDNEQLCVICHNPSSSDKNNRKELYAITNADGSVNTDATYDGKESETYDMRVMIHAIHGVSKRVVGTDAGQPKPWTLYRGRGIYQFVPQLFGPIAGDEGETEAVDFPLPTGWPTAAGSQPIFGSTNGSTQTHNLVTVHYPRPASECTACHNDEAFEAPNQALAVPLTVDAVGPDYADQSDDVVIGPGAAACTACHAESTTRIHATSDFGYRANVLKEDMLDQAAQ